MTDDPTVRPDSGESTDITCPFGEPIDWNARLQAAVAATLAKRAERRNERDEFKARRDHGLKQRHAAKLARIKAAQEEP